MDSFVTIRLSDLALNRRGHKAGTASSNEPTPAAEISDEMLVAQSAQGSREALGILILPSCPHRTQSRLSDSAKRIRN